jgi:hypothetical protein
MAENGSAAVHGGELEDAYRSVLRYVTQQAPPWKAALPGRDLVLLQLDFTG